MNEHKARKYLESLRDQSFGDFKIIDFIGVGKSAAVYKGQSSDSRIVAIKIFDPELESDGNIHAQNERINRQLQLAGHKCPTLIQILSAGRCNLENIQTPYIAMEYIEGENLQQKIKREKKLDDAIIRNIFKDIYEAADYLLKSNLCHRDIKPENVQIKPDGHAILLDVGVIRPISASSNITGLPNGRKFIGTLRYSPPEMLHGREVQDINGWTAITIYQLGAILYEMIMGEELFAAFGEPYADLVQAVDSIDPAILRSDIGQDLIKTTKKCLYKDPAGRLSLISWSQLINLFTAPEAPPKNEATLSQLTEKIYSAKANYRTNVIIPRETAFKEHESRIRIADNVENLATKALDFGLEEIPKPKIKGEPWSMPSVNYRMVTASYEQSIEHGLVRAVSLCLIVSLEQNPIGKIKLDGLGFIWSWSPPGTTRDYRATIKQLMPQIIRGNDKTIETLYEDLVDDSTLGDTIRAWSSKMLLKYMNDTKPELDAEIQYEKNLNTHRYSSRVFGTDVRIFNTSKCLMII